MTEVLVFTTAGGQAALKDQTVSAFGSRLRGELLRPGSSAYEEARKVWNGMVDKRPALIVRCAGVNDVVDAVKFAREHGLVTSVRDGGGHNIPRQTRGRLSIPGQWFPGIWPRRRSYRGLDLCRRRRLGRERRGARGRQRHRR